MGPVDLDNCLNDSLLYFFHSVKLFVQYFSGLRRINGIKVVAFPADVQHGGQCSLRVSFFLRGNLRGFCHRKISSCPDLNIFRQGASGACQEICDCLNACDFHVITGKLRVFAFLFGFRSLTGEQPLYHVLQKSVLRREFGTAAESFFTDPIDRVPIFSVFAGKPDRNPVGSKPFQKAYKTCVYFQDVSAFYSAFSVKLEGCSVGRVGKNPMGMVRPLVCAVV